MYPIMATEVLFDGFAAALEKELRSSYNGRLNAPLCAERLLVDYFMAEEVRLYEPPSEWSWRYAICVAEAEKNIWRRKLPRSVKINLLCRWYDVWRWGPLEWVGIDNLLLLGQAFGADKKLWKAVLLELYQRFTSDADDKYWFNPSTDSENLADLYKAVGLRMTGADKLLILVSYRATLARRS